MLLKYICVPVHYACSDIVRSIVRPYCVFKHKNVRCYTVCGQTKKHSPLSHVQMAAQDENKMKFDTKINMLHVCGTLILYLHYMYKPCQHSCQIIAKRNSKPYWGTKTR